MTVAVFRRIMASGIENNHERPLLRIDITVILLVRLWAEISCEIHDAVASLRNVFGKCNHSPCSQRQLEYLSIPYPCYSPFPVAVILHLRSPTVTRKNKLVYRETVGRVAMGRFFVYLYRIVRTARSINYINPTYFDSRLPRVAESGDFVRTRQDISRRASGHDPPENPEISDISRSRPPGETVTSGGRHGS